MMDVDDFDPEEDEETCVELEEDCSQDESLNTSMLGYRPQKLSPFNSMLAIEERLMAEESVQWFNVIKTNLSRAIAMRELRPGVVTWLGRLARLMRMHNLMFSKKDHVASIQMLYELLTLHNLEPSLVIKTSLILVSLLKRKELLKPIEDLQLDWKVVHSLHEKFIYSKEAQSGLILFPPERMHAVEEELESNGLTELPAGVDTLESSMDTMDLSSVNQRSIGNVLASLTRHARVYFSVSSTKEILDEFRPLLCPFDTSMQKAMGYLHLFLNTFGVIEYRKEAFDLWFNELMALWKAFSNHPRWEKQLITLMARLAEHNIGEIDWSPHLPFFYNKLQLSFNLPVLYKKTSVTSGSKWATDTSSMCRWIVSTVGNESATLDYLQQMVHALESYFHIANTGRHSKGLNDFLYKLTHHFILRLRRERHSKARWGQVVRADWRLSDADVERFVLILRPLAFLSMYNVSNVGASAQSLNNLATLRPDLIVPELVERLRSTLETFNEPNKLVASLCSLTSVARYLVRPLGSDLDCREHVIPMLLSSLPGIDANDMRKTFATFQFIATMVTWIPMVDCSKRSNDKDDEMEKVVCGQTALLEDFISQFLDQCLSHIESSSLVQTREELSSNDYRSNKEETMGGIGIATTLTALLYQCDAHHFKVALKKVEKFVCNRIMETKVSGKLAAALVRCLCRVRPELALPLFLPRAIDIVNRHLEDDELYDAITLDDELKFNLLIIAECCRCGRGLLPYVSSLEGILKKAMNISNREAGSMVSVALRAIFASLTSVTSFDMASDNALKESNEGAGSTDDALKPKNIWGKTCSLSSVSVDWFVPSKSDIEAAQNLLHSLLEPRLDLLREVSEGRSKLSKERMQNNLAFVSTIVQGSASMLPFWSSNDAEIVELKESCASQDPYVLRSVDNEAVLTLQGRNVRLEVLRVMQQVQAFMMKESSDDTTSLETICHIYECLLVHGGLTAMEHEHRLQGFNRAKKGLESKLLGGKSLPRALIVERAILQYEARIVDRYRVPFTTLHLEVFKELLTHSTSHYSRVRIRGQDVLLRCFSKFPHSSQQLLPDLLALLSSETSDHEQFKGTLYLLLGTRNNTMLAKHNWEALFKLWPSLIDCRQSEKPSVIKVMDKCFDHVSNNMESFDLVMNVSDNVVDRAKVFFDANKKDETKYAFPSVSEIEQGLQSLQTRNENNLANYNALIDVLCDRLESNELHWRRHNLALAMLGLLMRHDHKFGLRPTHIFLKSILSDSVQVRSGSEIYVANLLQQYKRKHVRVELEVDRSNGGEGGLVLGRRADNDFMCYDSQKVPTSQSDWDERRFIHKTCYGYYVWPKKMEVYAASSLQPSVERESLSEVERAVLSFFEDKANLDKLINFHCIEEHRGRDKFSAYRYIMFKHIFRNLGASLTSKIAPCLKQLLDKDVSKDGSYRCAAEMIAGLIRGSKHWDYETTSEMWQWLKPLLAKALNKLSVDNESDWVTALSTVSADRDPHRIHWLIELLMEELENTSSASVEASKLFVMQSVFSQQEWRAGDVFIRLMDKMKAKLTHRYQNVRIKIGATVNELLKRDVGLTDDDEEVGLKCSFEGESFAHFIDSVVCKLDVLKQIDNENDKPIVHQDDKSNGLKGEEEMHQQQQQQQQTMVPGMPNLSQQQLMQLAQETGMPANVSPQQLMQLRMRMPDPAMMRPMMPNPAMMPNPTMMPNPAMLPNPAMMPMRMPDPGVMQMMPNPGMMPNSLMETELASSSEDSEREVAKRLLETTCKIVSCRMVRSFLPLHTAMYKLLPVLFVHESNLMEPNLRTDCLIALAPMAKAILSKKAIETLLDTLDNLLNDNNYSWRAKLSALDFLQVAVFTNLASFVAMDKWVVRVRTTVLKALEHERIEVRDKAASVLSGLLHCRFVPLDENKALMASFKKTLGKRRRRRLKTTKSTDGDELIRQHAAVLALCAFVNASPYDVPDELPDILMTLTEHLHDQAPIPATIKRTMQDFKRTHLDNWQDHRLKFTDDQLSVLTDVLVSPGYYA